MKRWGLFLATVLLSGCSIWPTQKLETGQPNATESIRQAELLRKQRQYSESEHLLFKAKRRYPDNIQLQQLLERTLLERRRYRQLIEDQLLVARLTQIQQQLPLLAQLAKSEADDLMIRSHLQQLEKEWQAGRPSLSVCGERQLINAPETAEKCLRLALTIDEQKSDRERLTQIESGREIIENVKEIAAEKTEKKQRQTQRQALIQQLLKQARSKWESGERYDALILLEHVLKLKPKSANAIRLKTKIQNELEDYTQSLLAAGDTLYQKGKIEGAIAAWNALLTLDPEHAQAQEKIERAQKVLENLQQLRQQKESVAGKTE